MRTREQEDEQTVEIVSVLFRVALPVFVPLFLLALVADRFAGSLFPYLCGAYAVLVAVRLRSASSRQRHSEQNFD